NVIENKIHMAIRDNAANMGAGNFTSLGCAAHTLQLVINDSIFKDEEITILIKLKKVATKYLSAPPTSVANEQLFSAAGQIYADRRANLLGENIDKLLFPIILNYLILIIIFV
ncbi:hypothetical protein X777_09153, partial [Ooceraea biroi]